MNIGSSFIAGSKSAELMEPSQGSLDDPTRLAEAASVSRIAMRHDRLDSSNPQLAFMIFRSVCSVSLHSVWPLAWPPCLSGDRPNGVDQRQEFGDVMSIRRSDRRREWNSRSIGNYVMLAPWFAAIGRVWADFWPPSTARTEALSTTARDQSIWSVA